MRLQGHNIKDLQWRAPASEWGSYLSIIAFMIAMTCQIVSCVLPPVLQSEAGESRIGLALRGLLGFFIFGLLFIGHVIYVARKGRSSWRETFLIPLGTITLPELEGASLSDEAVKNIGSTTSA